MKPHLVTEEWLTTEFGLGRGTEIHLPLGSELAAAAAELIRERQIRIKYVDGNGRVYDPAKKSDAPQQIHPLTGRSGSEESAAPSVRKSAMENSEALTHLDAHTLVAKNHPRIALRGKLDTLIAFTVLVQADFDAPRRYPWLHPYLADIRSHIGNLLRVEVTGEPAQPVVLGTTGEEILHRISHNPLKYLGHDHIVPEQQHGRNVALLNVLRALAREVEVAAADNFIRDGEIVDRPDLLRAVNRLSSAIYVLMLLTLQAEGGKMIRLEDIVVPE